MMSPSLTPAPVGELDQVDKESLWKLFTQIGNYWNISSLSEEKFVDFLNEKTKNPPSYLGEYKLALSFLKEQTSSPDQKVDVLTSLLAEPTECEIYFDEKKVEIVYLGTMSPGSRVKYYVISEFIRLHLISGGFKTFGLHNYRGYDGGPSLYRRVEI